MLLTNTSFKQNTAELPKVKFYGTVETFCFLLCIIGLDVLIFTIRINFKKIIKLQRLLVYPQ